MVFSASWSFSVKSGLKSALRTWFLVRLGVFRLRADGRPHYEPADGRPHYEPDARLIDRTRDQFPI